MPFTDEEAIGYQDQGVDIAELLMQGYTEEEIRLALDQTLEQKKPDFTSTAPIKQEEIDLPDPAPMSPSMPTWDENVTAPTPQESPSLFQGLDVDVDQLLAEGYSMDEIQAVSDQFKENPPEDSPQGIANSVKGEVDIALDDVNKVVETADIIAPGVKETNVVGDMTFGDLGKNLKMAVAEMYPGLFGYGTDKLGEFTGSKGMEKWGEELQATIGKSKQETWADLSPRAKEALKEKYFDPQVGEFASKLWDNILHGKEIKREDYPEKFWGNASGDKILLDLSSGIASAPLMLSGLGFTKFFKAMGLGTTSSAMLGVGTPFAVTEGLSVGKSINELVDGMSHEELYSSPLVQSIDNVLREQFPDAKPAQIEKFVRLQVGNQLAFEYGGYAGAFSLITDGGVGAMAFKKIRGQVADAAVSTEAKRSFMKRVGNVATVTGAEFAQEFTQEGLNKLFENFAAQDAGKEIGSFTDVPNSAMSGGIGGTGPGFVLGTGVEILEGSVAKKKEKAEEISKNVEEDKKLAEEEGDVLPKNVFETGQEGIWSKRGKDTEGTEKDYLIGFVPSASNPEKMVYKIALPDMSGDGDMIQFDQEFDSLEEASLFIEGQHTDIDDGDDGEEEKKQNEETIIEEVEDESTEVPTETEEEEQTDTTEDEQEDVEDIGEDIDEELVDIEDDPTAEEFDIDEPIDEEVVDEEPTEEPPIEDDIPESGTWADLKAKERDVISEIESLRDIDPNDPAIPFVEDELSEIQSKIAEEEAGIDRGRADEELETPRPIDVELEEAERVLRDFEENTKFTDVNFPGPQQREYGELQKRLAKAKEAVARADAVAEQINKEYEDTVEETATEEPIEETTEVEEDVGKVTSAGELLDGRAKFNVDGLNVEIRNDGSTIIVTSTKGEILKTAGVDSEGNVTGSSLSNEGKRLKTKVDKAVGEATKKIKKYLENKPLSSGKRKGKIINPIWTEDIDQEISSKETSVPQTPRGVTTIIKKGLVKAGQVIADIGGGAFNMATNTFKEMGITNLVFDPFNRTKNENLKVAGKIQNGGADASTVFNVLNVIKEKAGRIKVLKQAQNATKEGGKIFIGVHPDTTKGNEREAQGLPRGGPTTKGWQNREPLSYYRKEVEEVFGKENVKSKDGLLVVTKPKAKKSKADQPQPSGKKQGQKKQDKKKKQDGKPEKGEGESKKSPLWKLKRMLISEEEVVKRSDIINWFQDTFGKKIKSFLSIQVRDAAGLFFPNSESVRIKKPNDIEVASHEMAHWLETELDRAFQQEDGVTINGKKYKQKKGKVGRSIWISGSRTILTKEMQEELKNLDYDQREKQGRRNYEGFAEYFRLMLSGFDMSKPQKRNEDGDVLSAPKFHKFFMEKLLGNKEIQNHFKKEFGLDMIETIDSGKKLFSKWYSQGSFNRMLASSGMIEEKKPFLAKVRKVWEKVEEFFSIEYDSLHKLEMVVKRINEVRKRNGLKPLRPSKDPFQIATSENLSSMKIADTLINDRVINHNAEELFVVTKKGSSNLEVGKKVTQLELDEANKDSKDKAEVRKIKTLVQSFGNISEDEMNSFVVYGIALRSHGMHERGIESGMGVTDVEYVLSHKEEYGWKPEWDQAWKDITEWHGVLLDWLVDAGRMNDELRTIFKETNPVYLPFKRAFVDEAIGNGGGDMLTPSSLKRMKGSTRELLNPIDAIQQHTTSMVNLAIKSRILTALADVVPTNGIGDIITKVPAKARSMNTFIGPLKKQLKTIIAEDAPEGIEGINDIIDNIEDDTSLTIFYRDKTYKGKKGSHVVPIFRNGEIVLYEVDNGLYDVIAETTKFESDVWFIKGALKVLRPFASMARLGWTGLNIKFNLWTNPMRDIPLAAIYSKGNTNPLRFVRGVKTAGQEYLVDELLNKKDTEWTPSRRFKGGGGSMSTINGLETALWQAWSGTLNWRRKGVNKTMMFMKHPIKGISAFMGGVHGVLSATELGPRVEEFESVYNKTKEIQAIALEKQKKKQKLTEEEVQHLDWTEEDHYIFAKSAGKDVTFNYTKSGKWGKVINQAWPFHNATMQGPNKAYRAFKEDRIKFLTRSILWITLPSIVSWSMSKDEEWYKNIGNNYNNMNTFFEASKMPGLREALIAMGIDPKNKILVVPTPHETGLIFNAIPRAALDELYLHKKGAVWSAIKDAIETMKPGIAKLQMPAMVQPLLEVEANKSHWGRHIVPPYMNNSYSPKLPEEQVFPWTSHLARGVSKLFQDMSKATNTETFKFNPIQLEYLLHQYTGGLGTQGVTVVEDALFGTKSGRGFLNITLRMPHRPARQIELFYDEYNELQSLKSADKATGVEIQRLKLMKAFKKNNLDVLNKRKRTIGKKGIPEGDEDVKKLNKVHKLMASKLNQFLGSKYKDLK